MNLHLIIAYSLFLTAFLDAALAFLLLKNNPLNKNFNRSAAVLAFTAALFSLSAGLVYFRDYLGLNYDFYYRACWIGWLGIPAAFQCSLYLKDDQNPKAYIIGVWLYSFWVIVLVLCFTTNWLEIGAPSLIPFVPHYGPFKEVVRSLGGGMIFWMICILFKTRREVSGIKKAQLNYFTFGIFIYGLVAIACQIIEKYGIDPAFIAYGSFIFVALTFYSITRYRLFDIQIILSNILVIVLLTLILGGVNILLFRILVPYLDSAGAVFISLFVIITIFLTTPLRRFVGGGINDIFLGDKYNYQEMLKESSQAIVTMLDKDELLNYLVHAIQQGFKIHKVCLFLKDESTSSPFLMSKTWGYDENLVIDNQLFSEHFVEWLMENKKIFIKEEQQESMNQVEFNRLYGNLDKIEAELILPLVFRNNLTGFFVFGPKGDRHSYIQSDISILQTLASQAAIAIENSRLYSEAIIDSMTRLYHHKYFMMRLHEEMQRAKRYGSAMNLLMIDIDHFKDINDICGHLTGDKVLMAVAQFLRNQSRSSDIVARYGGEEFAMILVETDHEGSLLVAQRLRKKIEEILFDGNIKITVSIGVGSYIPKVKEMTKEDLIESADKALYLAKKNGRNRVESYEL